MESGISIRKGLQKEVTFNFMFLRFKSRYIYYALYSIFASSIISLMFSNFIPSSSALILGVIILIITLTVILFYSTTYGETGFVKKIADKKNPEQIRVVNNYKTMLIWKK